MSSVVSNCAFCRNLGLGRSEGAGTFAFLLNVPKCVIQDKLVIVYVWVEGAIPMLLHPILKDGYFIVGLDQFLLELDDRRELLVRGSSAAIAIFLLLLTSGGGLQECDLKVWRRA